MKKSVLLKYGIPVIGFIVLLIVFMGMAFKRSSDEAGISRFDWIQMLTENFGISEYANDTPYYKDVDTDSLYFGSIQAAYEWEILEKDSFFRGEKSADGEFVALTAMKAIGKYKVQIYMGISEEPDEKDYLALAVEEKLIDKEQLDKTLSEEESRRILEKAGSLYIDGLWVDDVVQMEYRDNVIEIDNKSIKSADKDYSEIVLSDNMEKVPEAGDVVIFEEQTTGRKFAKEIVKNGTDGKIELAETSIDKVLESLVVSDISEVKFEDILTYYGTEKNNLAASRSEKRVPALTKHINASMTDGGFTIHLSAEDGELSVKLEDNDTGKEFSLPVDTKIGIKSTMEASIDVRKIYAGVQTCWTAKEGMEYIDIQIGSDIDWEGEISVSKEVKISLGKAPVYLGNGIVGVDIEFYLVLSADGTISIQANLPVKTAVTYEKGAGFRRYPADSSYPEPMIMAKLSVNGTCILKTVPRVLIFCWDVLDLGMDVGISIDAQSESRSNSNVVTCTDLSIALPTLTVGISMGEDAKRVFEKFNDEESLEKEWEIFTEENAPFKKGLHYEEYADMTSEVVEGCTFKESETAEFEMSDLLPEPHRYIACFNSDFVDKGSYYEVTGMLIDDAMITGDDLENMEIGEVYSYDGMNFTLEEKRTTSFDSDWYTFTDDKGRPYIAGPTLLTTNEGKKYYYIHAEIEIANGEQLQLFTHLILDYKYNFKIPRDEAIEIMKNRDEFDANYSAEYMKLTEITVFDKGLYFSPWILTPAQLDSPAIYIDANSLEVYGTVGR